MQSLNFDTLTLTASQLPYGEIVRLCQADMRMMNICRSDRFWERIALLKGDGDAIYSYRLVSLANRFHHTFHFIPIESFDLVAPSQFPDDFVSDALDLLFELIYEEEPAWGILFYDDDTLKNILSIHSYQEYINQLSEEGQDVLNEWAESAMNPFPPVEVLSQLSPHDINKAIEVMADMGNYEISLLMMGFIGPSLIGYLSENMREAFYALYDVRDDIQLIERQNSLVNSVLDRKSTVRTLIEEYLTELLNMWNPSNLSDLEYQDDDY